MRKCKVFLIDCLEKHDDVFKEEDEIFLEENLGTDRKMEILAQKLGISKRTAYRYKKRGTNANQRTTKYY